MQFQLLQNVQQMELHSDPQTLHNAGMQHTDALRMHNISLCALSLMKFALPD